MEKAQRNPTPEQILAVEITNWINAQPAPVDWLQISEQFQADVRPVELYRALHRLAEAGRIRTLYTSI